jgi:hypothetical protein
MLTCESRWTVSLKESLYIYIFHIYKILNYNIPCHVSRIFDEVDEYFVMWQYFEHGLNLYCSQ